MADIAFLAEGITFKFSGARKTSSWLEQVARKERINLDSLTYIFCSDAFLAGLNKKYLKHSTLTDILTFDYSEKGLIQGEIYISIPRVRENAKTYAQPFARELRRVIVHGLLHLAGYKDKTNAQVKLMRRKEEGCLSLWP
ncbi:MAG: rRNA maturation RNase YbeY [Cytophagales bacterium]|nr:rRNA maturation RNase YbeY [Cytophagales bacterium]